MAKIYNSSIAKNAYRILGMKAGDTITPLTNDVIQPTIDVYPRQSIVHQVGRSTSGTLSISLESGKVFVLTGMQLSLQKSAACDVASGSYTMTTDIVGFKNATSIAVFVLRTLTEERIDMYIPYDYLRISGTVNLGITFAAGVCNWNITIHGHYQDD